MSLKGGLRWSSCSVQSKDTIGCLCAWGFYECFWAKRIKLPLIARSLSLKVPSETQTSPFIGDNAVLQEVGCHGQLWLPWQLFMANNFQKVFPLDLICRSSWKKLLISIQLFDMNMLELLHNPQTLHPPHTHTHTNSLQTNHYTSPFIFSTIHVIGCIVFVFWPWLRS